MELRRARAPTRARGPVASVHRRRPTALPGHICGHDVARLPPASKPPTRLRRRLLALSAGRRRRRADSAKSLRRSRVGGLDAGGKRATSCPQMCPGSAVGRLRCTESTGPRARVAARARRSSIRLASVDLQAFPLRRWLEGGLPCRTELPALLRYSRADSSISSDLIRSSLASTRSNKARTLGRSASVMLRVTPPSPSLDAASPLRLVNERRSPNCNLPVDSM